jgi:ribonuclease HII
MSRWTRKEMSAFIEKLADKNLNKIKEAVSGLEPPYPLRLLEALKQDERAGVAQVRHDLRNRQLAQDRLKKRVKLMLRHEEQAKAEGYAVIAGVDEVGRGPLAGPVVAAAVILPSSIERLSAINDSKLLTDAQRRESLTIIAAAADIGVGVVSVEEIDRINIHRANLLAFKLAIEDLEGKPDLALIDGRHQSLLSIPQRAIIKGDRLSMSIAAASIVAKVVRDQMMLEFDKKYPQYGFAHHKGYGTADHLAALKQFGPSPIHRRSFAPVRESLNPLLL